MTFIVDDIISENGLTATTLISTTISSTNFSATTLNGNGSALTNLTSNQILTSPNFSIQYDENNTLSGSSKFIYSGDSLFFTGVTRFNGLFYRTNSPSIKQVHQWVGSITFGATPGVIWGNMPAGTTSWLYGTSGTLAGDATFITDLTEYTECRLFTSMQVAGFQASTSITVQYSTDNTNWFTLVPLTIGNTTGAKDSGWLSIPNGARTFVYIRLVGAGGNGTVDPRFSPPILLAR